MSVTDIFCVPSKKEALGITNIEALAIGITVVSTRTGGIPEVLNYGKNGYLADKCSVMAIKKALLSAINDTPSGRQKKAIAGQHWVRENYNAKKIETDFLKILSFHRSNWRCSAKKYIMILSKEQIQTRQ